MTRVIKRAESLTEQIVDHASNANQFQESYAFVSTGSALLNLALSDRTDGGYVLGKIVNEVGDRSSGKTFKCLTTLAEAAHSPAFNDYELVFDDAEAANEFNLVKLFGQRTADRIQPPNLDRESPEHSKTVQDFQGYLNKLLKADKPFIYILDSLDAISADEEIEHAEAVQKARDAGKEAKGSYGMQKAKHMSIMLRLIAAAIKKTQSLLIIISQTRDNVDPMSFTRKNRAGGRALEFYCSYESWLAVTGKLTTKINDKARMIGITTRVKISKNKFNGKIREIDLPIYYDLGVDDIGACIDFLINEKRWPKNGAGIVDAHELRLFMTRTKLIERIEENDLIEALHKVTQDEWESIENKLKLDRRPRYE